MIRHAISSNMSSMEQGLIPSVCLNEATSALSEGDKPSAEALETMNELSKALEEQEDELEDGEEEEEEEEEAGQSEWSSVCVCVWGCVCVCACVYACLHVCVWLMQCLSRNPNTVHINWL